NRSRRLVGIRLSLTCERTQRHGSGCISIGAIFPQTLTDRIRSMQISIVHSKTCSTTKQPEALQKVTNKGKSELRLEARLSFLCLFLLVCFRLESVTASLCRACPRRW